MDFSIFDQFNQEIKDIFIQYSFICLSQKRGNSKIAISVLEYTKNISKIHSYVFYTGKFNIPNPVSQLTRYGVLILPLIKPNMIEELQKEYDKTLLSFPIYNRDKDNPHLNKAGDPITYVLGGFAGLGNPGAYNAPLFRKLRLMGWKVLVEFFREYTSKYNKKFKNNYKLEILFERPMYRKKGMTPVAEAWHRDVIPKEYITKHDEIYGGWINLDTEDQYMSCLPGTQLNIDLIKLDSGFAEVKNVVLNELDQDEKKAKSVIAEISKNKHVFKIPPGHLIIFPQYIIHEVVATKAKHNMYRLFFGCRLTKSTKSLFNSEEIMRIQSISRLGGGMLPPMYSRNHMSCYLGIPSFTEKKDITFIDKISDKLVLLYKSDNMIKLYNKIKKENNQKNKRSIFADMIDEYRSQDILYFPFDKNKFINSNMSVNLGTFKTDPTNNKSITTLIKWSNDTIKPIALVEKTNNRGYKYKIAERYMKSLKEYKLPMYPQYTEEEKIIYKPYPLY